MEEVKKISLEDFLLKETIGTGNLFLFIIYSIINNILISLFTLIKI